MGDKTKKVRTSITIDPRVLARVRALASDPESDVKSVASFVERACEALLGPVDSPVDAGSDSNPIVYTLQESD